MRTYIVADPGSTHNGSKTSAMRAIKVACACGADAVKFQLLNESLCRNGNVMLNWKWMPDLIREGERLAVDVYASAFDWGGVDYLKDIGCKQIKFAFSQQQLRDDYPNSLLASFDKVHTSYSPIDANPWRAGVSFVKYYCIPQYPVPFAPNFEGIFPRFDGFSDHTLSVNAAFVAVKCGARYIEKHITVERGPTPDSRFALLPDQFADMVQRIRSAEAETCESQS